MSLASVRTFFRGRMNGLGYTEHTDAFDDENRPKHLLEKLYRIESGPVSSGPSSQSVHQFNFDITLQITLRGGRNNVDLADRAFTVADEILTDILPVGIRNNETIKDVVPGAITIAPFTASDDNDCILSLGFTGIVMCNF